MRIGKLAAGAMTVAALLVCETALRADDLEEAASIGPHGYVQPVPGYAPFTAGYGSRIYGLPTSGLSVDAGYYPATSGSVYPTAAPFSYGAPPLGAVRSSYYRPYIYPDSYYGSYYRPNHYGFGWYSPTFRHYPYSAAYHSPYGFGFYGGYGRGPWAYQGSYLPWGW